MRICRLRRTDASLGSVLQSRPLAGAAFQVPADTNCPALPVVIQLSNGLPDFGKK